MNEYTCRLARHLGWCVKKTKWNEDKVHTPKGRDLNRCCSNGEWESVTTIEEAIYYKFIPDYATDLNAVHVAELQLLKTDEHWRRYCCMLARVIAKCADMQHMHVNVSVPNNVLIGAKADVRTEALVRLLDKLNQK